MCLQNCSHYNDLNGKTHITLIFFLLLFFILMFLFVRIDMNKPELYNKSNVLQRKAVLACLKEYEDKIKWKTTDDTAIDLGCGDGSISVLVKNFASNSYKKFVACDISEEMIKFASKVYGDENIAFTVMDIGGEFPQEMKGAFNHVFSFFALQWVKNQEKGFRNIFDLMSDEGDCFITFLASTSIYSVYAALAHLPKWSTWLKRVDLFLSPYHEMKNPEKKIAEIMEKCGFKNIDVTCTKRTNVFDSVQALRNTVYSVEPFNMPSDVFEEFMQDYLRVGREIGILRISDPDNLEKATVSYDYLNIVIYATKY